MKLIFRLEIDVARTDGKKPRNVAQAMAEQLFELIENRCVDETFAIKDVDHLVSCAKFEIVSSCDHEPNAALLGEAWSLCDLVDGMRKDMLAKARTFAGDNRKAMEALEYYAPARGRTKALRALIATVGGAP